MPPTLSLHEPGNCTFYSFFPLTDNAKTGYLQPPPLSLMNLNSTGLNLSNLTSRSGITCTKWLGEDLNVESCHNAWQKIHGTQHAQRFLPRPSRSHPRDITPEDVVMPFRYLSNDGLCAIVRCPPSTSPLLFFCDLI